jgi:uncharacterized membrane protein
MDELIQADPHGSRIDWLTLIIGGLILFNGLPFLAPILMKIGWEGVGRVLYFIYGFFCHQMAQRSFFLFGPHGFEMYPLASLPVDDTGKNAELVLRQYLGSPTLGWKVAWSDRMVAMYLSPLLAAMVYGVARRRGAITPLPLWAFLLLLLPMALDGGTHMISDLVSGIGNGFRDSNAWLAALTGHLLPTSFYQGDALGSFNSIMRLFSGLTFGIAVVRLLFPWIDTDLTAKPNEPVHL